MGDEDFFRAPAVKQLRRLRPVRQAGENLRLGGVGLQIVDAGQVLPLLRPVVEGHGLVRLHMPQKALHVHGHLAMLRRLGKERPVKVAVDQAGEVVNFRLNVRKLLKAEGIAHAHGGAGALLLVGGEILVPDGAGGGGGLPEEVGAGPGEAGLNVGVGRVQLSEQGRPISAFRSGETGGHHGSADFFPLVALIVDVVVQGHRPNN